jgi:hypothetical protein
MKRLTLRTAIALIAVGVLGLGLAPQANASIDVTYSTTGTPTTIVPGLTFTGITSNTVDLSLGATNGSFGTFDSSGVTGTIAVNVPFTLTITQILPVPTGGSPASYTDVIKGTITATASNVVLTFSAPYTETIISAGSPSPVFYTVPQTLSIVSGSNDHLTTLQGTISAVPEPATLASLAFTALPLAGLAFWRRRKARA